MKLIIIAITTSLLTACSFTPNSGPYPGDIRSGANKYVSSTSSEDKIPYAIADITFNPRIDLPSQRNDRYATVSNNWSNYHSQVEPLGINIGDELEVTVYESEQGGLFLADHGNFNGGKYIKLPPQIVDYSGAITVPYVGRIVVANKSVDEVQEVIVENLQSRAIEPQVVLSFANRAGADISILGQVKSAQRYQIGFHEENVLDAIAAAGGVSGNEQAAFVTLKRDKTSATIHIDRLLAENNFNLQLRPKDVLYVYNEPEIFTLYGAIAKTGNYEFENKLITLSEAIGRGEGLLDRRADPRHVYIFRFEHPKIINSLGLNSRSKLLEPQADGYVPIIYKLDLSTPEGLLQAKRFNVEHQDMIYVANAKSVELSKFINIINPGSTTTINTRDAISND